MTTPSSERSAGILQKISYFAVIAALALIFLPSAYMKLSNAETIVENFSKWQLLDWKNLIAGAEIAGVILLLIPRTSLAGVLLLSAVMGGAIVTHFQFQEPVYFPAAILVVLWINYLFIRPKKTRA